MGEKSGFTSKKASGALGNPIKSDTRSEAKEAPH